MNPELFLSAVYEAVRQNLPPELDETDLESFFARNRATLLAVVRNAFPAGTIERPFTRLFEEHRLGRLVLNVVEHHLADPGAATGTGAELAELLDALSDHMAYENGVLFPFLRREVPHLAEAIDHAHEEHEYLGDAVFALSAALRAGRRYEGPAITATRHHFDEEERDLVEPALAAGLKRTPAGKPGRLTLFSGDIERLAAALPPTMPFSAGPEDAPPADGAADSISTSIQTHEHEEPTVADKLSAALYLLRLLLEPDWLIGPRKMLAVYDAAQDGGEPFALQAERLRRHALALPPDPAPDLDWALLGDLGGLLWRLRDELGLALAASAPGTLRAHATFLLDRMLPHLSDIETTAGLAALHSPVLDAALRYSRGEVTLEEVMEAVPSVEPVRVPAPVLVTEGEPTAQEGLAGPEIPRSRLRVGMRVVYRSHHGTIERADAYEVTTRVWGQDAETRTDYSISIRDDRGRRVDVWSTDPIFAELRGPKRLLKDPVFNGEGIAVEDLVSKAEHHVASQKAALEAEGRARLAEKKRGWAKRAADARATLGRIVAALAAWQDLHPHVVVAEVPPWRLRVWELEAREPGKRTTEEVRELAWLKSRPRDWYERLTPGIAVTVLGWGAADQVGWTLHGISETRMAILAQDMRRQTVPLWWVTPADVQDRPASSAETSWSRDTDPARVEAAANCREIAITVPGYGPVQVVCGAQGARDTWHNIIVRGTRYGFNGRRWAKHQRPPQPVLDAIAAEGITTFA